MSVRGRGSFSGNNNLPPNGRKRKLSNRNSNSSSDQSSSSSSSSSKQSRLNFTPNHKRPRLSVNNSNHSPPSLHHSNSREFEENSDMAHQTGTNNRMSFGSNSFMSGKAAATAGTNNHVKKPTQGKKLVIKNRKGTCRERICDNFGINDMYMCVSLREDIHSAKVALRSKVVTCTFRVHEVTINLP